MTNFVHVPAKRGAAYWTVGCMFRFLVSSDDASGSYTTMEITVPPGEGANPHSHADEEEQFYVIDGELIYDIDGTRIEAASGDFVHIPRGILHSFKNGSRQAKLLATFGPGTGIEQIFIDTGVLMTPQQAYGSGDVQPPPNSAPHRAG